MRVDAKFEQKKFWEIFEQKLIENGEPFSILHEKAGVVTYWAVINKKHSFVDNALSVDFLVREKKLRINIYVRDDLRLFSVFENHRQEIKTIVGEELEWLIGKTNPNTRRIAYTMKIEIGYYADYGEYIDKVLPIIDKMKKVCEMYAKHEFFDY